jgi:DNA-binding GntR family transcriptional regulator
MSTVLGDTAIKYKDVGGGSDLTHGPREQLIDRILELVTGGQLAVGQRTSEQWLAETLGTSRTPIRQALAALARELIVVQRPQSGVWIRAVAPREMDDALRVSYEIETRALGWALGLERSSKEELGSALAELHDAGSSDNFLRADTRFHVRLCELGGMPSGAIALWRWGLLTRIFCVTNPLSDELRDRLRTTAQTLVDAVEAGDENGAFAALRDNYQARIDWLRALGGPAATDAAAPVRRVALELS